MTNYHATARKIGYREDRDQGEDLDQFPMEKTRTRGVWNLFGMLACDLIDYGWTLHQRSHVIVPLILQLIQGLLGTTIYTFINTLLVDVFAESPITVAAAASISRCVLAAAGAATVELLISAMWRGWSFTAFTGAAGSLVVWIIRT